MIIVTKRYCCGYRDHWMVVDTEWKPAYRTWNLIQTRLEREKEIEPLWVTDRGSWSRVYGHIGENELWIESDGTISFGDETGKV